MSHQDWVSIYRNPHLDMETLHGYFREQAFSKHMHDYYVIGLIDKGVQTFSYRGKTKYITPPGGLFFLNPGEAHTGEAANGDGFEYYALYPKISHVQKIMADLAGTENKLPLFKNVRVDDSELANQLREMHGLLRDDAAALQSESMLMNLIAGLIKRYADLRLPERPLRREPKAIERAKEYIHANWTKGITLSDLAEAAGLSRYYFLRLFSHVVGMPPHAYLESVRLIHAKRLIKAGLALNDIAYATGFSDQSHFTNRFKQYLGVTPGQYAKERQ